MLVLRNVPDPRNADFWDHSSGDDGGSMNIIVWPADDGSKLVHVRVGLMALGEILSASTAAKSKPRSLGIAT